MGQYLGGRSLHSLVSLAGLIVLVFFLARLTGDPTNLYLPLDASLEARAEFGEKHGFNDPLIEQFGRFLEGLARFDLGIGRRVAGQPPLIV
jgi:peptide/nickel transport system permease protein